MPKKSGFTLVELLVVITIIAILSIIGLTLFTTVQKGARDAKRRGDVDAIFKAFEANYQFLTSSYPVPLNSWFIGGTIPKDPTGFDYYWNGAQSITTAVRTTYTICANLENANGNSSSAGNGVTFNPASGAQATYYCAKNAQ